LIIFGCVLARYHYAIRVASDLGSSSAGVTNDILSFLLHLTFLRLCVVALMSFPFSVPLLLLSSAFCWSLSKLDAVVDHPTVHILWLRFFHFRQQTGKQILTRFFRNICGFEAIHHL